MNRFVRYELRTTDVDAAKAFYAGVFGPDFWGPSVGWGQLPERAIARGAPAHWLGHIAVADPSITARNMGAIGGQQLGAVEPSSAGGSRTIMRDPFGAVVALTSAAAAPDREPVSWHLLHTEDHERAFAGYQSLLGWQPADALDLGPERGHHQSFRWDASAPVAGSISDMARLPGIHPQWLFFFPVTDFERAVARIRELGGLVVDTMETPRGDLVAPCDDPAGAAFGLYQTGPGPQIRS